jgi:hypothetical protein
VSLSIKNENYNFTVVTDIGEESVSAIFQMLKYLYRMLENNTLNIPRHCNKNAVYWR